MRNSLEITYKQYPNEKMIGVFVFGKPRLVIHDVELAKQILIKDFDHFMDRRSMVSSDTNEVSFFLVFLLNGTISTLHY